MGGDAADFIRSEYPTALRRAVLLVGDQRAAEALVQEAMVRLWAAWRRQPPDNPGAYLRTVTTNLAISGWRRRRLREVPFEMGPEPSVDDSAAELGEHDVVWRAVRALPPRQRAVIVLRYYEGLSEPEICAVLGMAPGTVRSQASKARDHLRSTLNNEEGAFDERR